MGIFTYEANATRVFVGGIEFHLLANIRGSDNYALEIVDGIGDIHVWEHVPTVARHEFTMTGFMVKNEQSVAAGIIPENGDAAMKGRTFAVEIFDKDGPLLRRYEKAMCNTADSSMAKHTLMMKDATFYATDVVGKFK